MTSIDLDKVLDKAWADKSLPEILAAPVGALADLKYVRWAQALAALEVVK
ncbi:hypothetical protein [Streptomyces sp. KR55]